MWQLWEGTTRRGDDWASVAGGLTGFPEVRQRGMLQYCWEVERSGRANRCAKFVTGVGRESIRYVMCGM